MTTPTDGDRDKARQIMRAPLGGVDGFGDPNISHTTLLDRIALALAEEREKVEVRLPEGMKNCTIVFRACEKGHGWLTATNWIDHGCPTCAKKEEREKAARIALKYDRLAGLLGHPVHTRAILNGVAAAIRRGEVWRSPPIRIGR